MERLTYKSHLYEGCYVSYSMGQKPTATSRNEAEMTQSSFQRIKLPQERVNKSIKHKKSHNEKKEHI